MTKLEGEIGLARRGGFITFGEDLMYKLERKRVCLVLLSKDCGWRFERYVNAIIGQTVLIKVDFNQEQLGQLIGARPLNAIGITNPGLANKIQETLRKEGEANV